MKRLNLAGSAHRWLAVPGGPCHALGRWLVLSCIVLGSAGLGAPNSALAGGGPQNVAIVVNPKDPDSLAVANAYVALRQIPGENVIYLPWALNTRSTPGSQYREKLLTPLLAELDRRKLRAHIDVVAFSSGYPYMVIFNDIPDTSPTPRPTAVAASLTGAAFLYQQVLEGSPEAFALNSNAYFNDPVGGRTKSLAFSGQQDWAAGSPTPSGGKRYLLSTALGVTYGRGNKPSEIIEYLQRAKAADGTAPRGTIYYMQNDNIRSQVRHPTFPAAVAELRSLGVNAEILRGVAPVGKMDVAGLTTVISHLQLKASNCKLTPGALIDNLTSAAGQFLIPHGVPNPQTPISDYLRAGGTGASGTVVEPFAIAAKFPSASLHVHYARGLSLSEAFYRSVAGPFQLIIIGDPLCQPWAVFPKVSVTGLSEAAPTSGKIELKPTASYPGVGAVDRFELFVDGVRIQTIAPAGAFQLDTTSLADGWREIRVVAIGKSDTATQGSKVVDVEVANSSDKLTLNVESTRLGVNEATSAWVTSTQAYDVTVMQNGRSLGRLPTGRGKLKVSGASLGKGPSRLYAVQQRDGQEVLRSLPVTVTVF
jgi:hypothetical protein